MVSFAEQVPEPIGGHLPHPKAIKVVQFKANLLSTEAKELDAESQEAKRQRLAAQQFVFGCLFS